MCYEVHSFDQGRLDPSSVHANPLALGAENGSGGLSPTPQPAPFKCVSFSLLRLQCLRAIWENKIISLPMR